jgi:uncharacterized protein
VAGGVDWGVPALRDVFESTVILETVYGSRAYGLAGPGSDCDRRGVFVPPPETVHGYLPGAEQVEPEAERVLYDVRKFFRLAAASNPTILEVLFTEPSDHLRVEPPGRRLLEARPAFLSKRAGASFGQYGLAQLRRIRTHRRWLLSPPGARPERPAFGLPDRRLLPKDQMGAAEALVDGGGVSAAELPASFLDVLDRERREVASRGV